MTTVLDMIERIKSFDLVQSAGNAMQANEQSILSLNRHQLYEQSVDADNNPLRSPYSPRYAAKKNRLRGKFITDLYYTGDFQGKFRLNVQGRQYIIASTSEHAPYAVKWADAPVYGLTGESKIEAWRIIKNDVVSDFCSQTGCKMK